MRRVFSVAISVVVLIALVAVPACTEELVPEPEHDLTMRVYPEDSGTTTPAIGTALKTQDRQVDITATAEDGWEFVNWTSIPLVDFDDPNEASTSFKMPGFDVEVTANFAALPRFEFTIVRDAFGVPHVFAEDKNSLAFGAGYAMAQDRLWQADVMRRTASGRLAELLGPDVLAQDMELRALWYNQEELLQIYNDWDTGAQYAHLKPMIEAYVEGINYRIDEVLDRFGVGDATLVPAEYMGLRLVDKLEHFTVADVVAVTVLMAWRFGGTGGNEGELYEALLTLQGMHGEAPGWMIWNDLFPLNDPGAPVTIPDDVYEADPLATSSFKVPDGITGLVEQYEESRARQDELMESLGIPTKFGSNAVPISPDLSATGNALQLGGPQMGYSVPQIVYEIGLHGDGINAVGMAFPSAGPFILIGVSEYGAWTSTTGASDVMDIRVLTLNPENPFQYKWYTDVGEGDYVYRDMEVREETFYVHRSAEPVEQTFYRSHYGPIVAMDVAEGTAFTLHTPFYQNEIGAEQSWQLFQEASSIEEFEAAVELTWPSHNFVWSGVDGNIGFWHAGRFPVKPETADPRLPMMGDGTQEWVRVTEPDEMPRSINPEQGWLANWNNKPIAGWPFAESDFHWGEGHRVEVLLGAMSMMAPGENLTTAHLNQLNQVGGYHHTAGMSFVGKVTAAAMASGNTTLEAAGMYLGAWATAEPLPVSYVDFESPSWPADPDPTYDHPGLTIFDAWYDRIVLKVFDGVLPPDVIGRVKGNPSLLIRVLRQDASLNYPEYPDEPELTTMIIEALDEAVTYLTREYGTDMSTWLTPVRMQNYDQMGALPGGPIHPWMNRGTYNHIAELRPATDGFPLGESVIPPGQSGFVAYTGFPSPHAYDQVPLYASWTYKPMWLTRAEVEAVKTWEKDFIVD